MPPKARLEMVCDWIGAGRAQNREGKTPKWRAEHEIALHQKTKEWVDRFMTIL